MIKNVSGQKIRVFAWDATTGLPKTGDAANITASISKDFGAVADLADTSATEEDSTKSKGYYLFDISQSETNADDICITGRSSTSNIVVVGAPARIVTVPANFGALSVNSSGQVTLMSSGLDAVLIESGISVGAALTDDNGTQLTSINARQALAIQLSALAAVLAGAATTNVTTKQAAKPGGNTRINATVDSDGNRTSITLKVPT